MRDKSDIYVWQWNAEHVCQAERLSDGKEIVGYVVGEAPYVYIIPLDEWMLHPLELKDEMIYHVKAVRVHEGSIKKIRLKPPVSISNGEICQ